MPAALLRDRWPCVAAEAKPENAALIESVSPSSVADPLPFPVILRWDASLNGIGDKYTRYFSAADRDLPTEHHSSPAATIPIGIEFSDARTTLPSPLLSGRFWQPEHVHPVAEHGP